MNTKMNLNNNINLGRDKKSEKDPIYSIPNPSEYEMIIQYQKDNKNREKIIFYEFLNFLEIYIHTTIYSANVYPKEAFKDFQIYNLSFLKFMVDDTVSDYISEFLKNIEQLLFARFVNKIYILIIDADSNTILEVYNCEIEFNEIFYDLSYENLCLGLKSVLYKLYTSYINKTETFPDKNKTFSLCIETKESKIFSDQKLFDEVVNCIEVNFVKNLFKNDLLKLYQKRDVCVAGEIICSYFSINISKNYL